MQIRVVEHSDQEGEIFNYVLIVSDKTANSLKEIFNKLDPQKWQIYLNTNYTTDKIQELNDMVSNNYLDYIGLYEFKEEPEFTERWVIKTFYRANGLSLLSENTNNKINKK